MGKSKISIIIAREFAIRVKKRSFILTTLLTPLLFAALMIVPSLIAIYSGGEEGQRVSVVDNSGIVMPYMESDKEIVFEQAQGSSIDDLKRNFDNLGVLAIVGVSPLDSSNNVTVETYSKKQVNMELQSRIRRNVEDAVSQYKLQQYDIPQLEEILSDIQTSVEINTFVLDDEGEGKESKVEIFMIIGYICSFMIYMFIFMFGNMVMRSVIDEKSNRIIEVIVSSVKPFQLLMGKILGVASVAVTQFMIWIVFTLLIVSVVGSAIGFDSAAQMPSVPGDIPVEEIQQAVEGESSGFIAALKEINFVQIIGCFILYFILGYLLYSSMFAAVGAAVDNEADTQQLVLPITMPLIVGLFLMLHTFQYPDSALSFWGSMIPFTSPMVMMARIAYGVPAWELALSIGLLVVTFLLMAYLSGKIYRVGILMYGKKPGWKELWKWLKY